MHIDSQRSQASLFVRPARAFRGLVFVALGIAAIIWNPGNRPLTAQSTALAAWSFNEGTGTTLGDSSGNNRTGTISTATWTTGKYGQALNFDGNDYVSIGDLDMTGSFTVMAWMQTRSLVSSGCASLIMKALDYGFEICNGRLYAGVGSGSAWTAYVSQPLTSSDLNVWKHVALTYDGTTTRFYIGGALVASQAGSHGTNNNSLVFGRWTSGEFWNGLIDEVRIYGRALNQSEIQTDLNTPVPDAAPPPPALFQNDILISGLDLPTNIEFLPNGTMLIGELGGKIQILRAGATQLDATPFLTLTNIGTQLGQQGLMDIELDPAFSTNNFYYVFYTLGSPNRDRVSRFTANGLTTVAGSELVIWQDLSTANAEHHGGDLSFGPDGKLYITVGEHFDAPNAQNLTNFRGKVLRINSDGTVPTDNPFNDGAGSNREEIWAIGLRNPFRASFDSVTGRYYIGDVGGNVNSTAIEELNVATAGKNFGWPTCEGSCSTSGMTNPLFTYSHAGRDAAIVAGFVYRGTQFPSEYVGNFFYADYTQNWIRRLTLDVNGNVTGNLPFEPLDGTADGPYGDIVHLTQGPDGALYYTDLGYSDVGGQFGTSKIRRIRYIAPGNLPPVVASSANPTSGVPPLSVNFSSAGSSDPEGQPLTYLWDFGDGTTGTTANPTHVYNLSGHYTVVLTVSDGTTPHNASPLSITVGNPPQVTILSPTPGLTFRAGDTITITGDASDPEDGPLPASAFSWVVNFHHETHIHPGLPLTGVKTGSFSIPTSGHDYSGFTRHEVILTVTDSTGLQTSTSVFIFPQKVNLSFDTSPSGRTLRLDGIDRVAPFVHDTLIGFSHTIEAPNQTQGNNTYTFQSWTDGGAQSHSLLVPAANTSYTATFGTTVTPPTGLVAAWGFNEGTGTTLSDSSGNGRNGTITGATWTTGRFGQALNFDGNDLVTLSDLDLTGPFTVMAWMQTRSLFASGCASLVMKPRDYGFEICNSRLYAGVGTGSAWTGYVSQALTSADLNTWKHVALTYDGTTLRYYIGGTLITSATGAHGSNNTALLFGRWTPAGEFWNGLIDEVRIYSRALTQPEIQTDLNTPVGGGQPNTPPTISSISDRTTSEDVATTALPFIVGDAQTPAASLTVTGATSNPTLVPVGNIVLGGSGTDRTVTITPALNQSGTATITLTVSDGQATTPMSFLLTVTAVNDTPTISSLSNQGTTSGTAVGPLALTVGDVETAAGSLTLSGGSSNTTLVPVSNIVFGGSGASRTVTVTPASGQSGSATITVTVSDGQATAPSSFLLTVTAANTPPTISPISDQTTPEDTQTASLTFTIGDAQTAPDSLTISGGTTNSTLVPLSNIVFSGTGTNRGVRVTPAANQTGTATIIVTVGDGQASAAASFVLTVTAVNDQPTISALAAQTTTIGTAVGPLALTVGDVETAAGSLTLTGATTNPTLVPVANIVFGGSGASRNVTVTPAAGQSGTATITVTVSDGQATAPTSFLLTVSGTPPSPLTFAQSKGAANDASGTSLTVQLTNVKAGSLLVAFVKWEGSAASTVTLSDGTSTFTADALNSAANNDLHGRFYYLLASSASGTVNYTATWSASRAYRKFIIYEYNYGGTVSFDASSRSTGTSGTLTSGSLTTSGTNEVVFGAYGEYNTNNTNTERVNGVAADQVLRTSYTSMWSKGFASPFTGAATASGNSSTWIGSAIAFKRN